MYILNNNYFYLVVRSFLRCKYNGTKTLTAGKMYENGDDDDLFKNIFLKAVYN